MKTVKLVRIGLEVSDYIFNNRDITDDQLETFINIIARRFNHHILSPVKEDPNVDISTLAIESLFDGEDNFLKLRLFNNDNSENTILIYEFPMRRLFDGEDNQILETITSTLIEITKRSLNGTCYTEGLNYG